MKKVITYGTFDLLHQGHINILKRAKELGDYLIVGVTSDDFDKQRGKINVKQSLMERVQSVKKTGLADEILIEEYEGQKIDDIKRKNIDIFTVGSDWKGKFDYLNDYCQVIYLPRTEGISSSDLRSQQKSIKLGLVGNDFDYLMKFKNESIYVNGLNTVGVCTDNLDQINNELNQLEIVTNDYDEFLNSVDAVFISSEKDKHYDEIKKAFMKQKHVLCESPITLSEKEYGELFSLAKKKSCILMEDIRTAYSTAYERLLLLLAGGVIGDIVSVESTCTSMKQTDKNKINSLYNWGSLALLPVFQILGVNYKKRSTITKYFAGTKNDLFTKINYIYPNATATIKVAEGAKSEGQLIISGTRGYIYVPAPWWKTDYFEIRYENQNQNKRYFYQLNGEGIRYELVAFYKSILNKKMDSYINPKISKEICKTMEDFKNEKDVEII